MKKEIEELQTRLTQLDSDKLATEKQMREDLSQLHSSLIGKMPQCCSSTTSLVKGSVLLQHNLIGKMSESCLFGKISLCCFTGASWEGYLSLASLGHLWQDIFVLKTSAELQPRRINIYFSKIIFKTLQKQNNDRFYPCL